MDVLSVRRALKDTRDNMMRKATDRTVELQERLMGQLFGAAMNVIKMVA